MFQFKNRHLKEFTAKAKIDNRPLKAAKRIAEETINNRHSSIKFDDAYNDIIIPVTIFLIEKDITLRRQILREMAYWLDGEGKLIFDDEQDKYYTARVDSGIVTSNDLHFDSFTVEFICEPFAYTNPILVESKSITSETKLLVTNNGTYETKPVFEINGNATSLTIMTPTESITLLNINQKTIIDTEKMLCYTFSSFGNKVNKLMDLQGAIDRLKLPVGTTELTLTGNNMNVNVIVKLQEKYL
ncbi:distal tail protein Dit [Clostridium formicaceticum]|uniref:Phage tail protein n=1 Tax=Clostridium formicaceticum TaxID=1497 RepID=A0AAC9RJT2_9CLOT|nr:distal tail protein Dit [Clostridium formicaceticum]AOY76922.1 hypothetical protein BJL90_14290 [Clostridium formicaceticum]ARE87401.1 Phage tail protein [Clostridium formicaceticum]